MLKIKIKTGNQATNNNYDLSQLLKEVANKIESGNKKGFIIDYNGNNVGSFEVNY